jgi:hypothetical protein
MVTVAKTLKLGSRVAYTDGNGFTKLGFVTGTPDSVKAGTGVSVPEEGAAHIYVVSPTGKVYHRENIPAGDGPRTFALL